MTKKKENPQRAGRKSLYDEKIKKNLELIAIWVAEGVSQADMCNYLDIDHSTWCDYKNKYPEFYKTLNKSKQLYASELKNTYSQLALGKLQTKKVIKERQLDKDTGKYKMVVIKEEVNDVPPNQKALEHLLAINDKAYRKTYLVEHGGVIGLNTNYKGMTDEDLLEKIAELEEDIDNDS